MNTYFYNEEKTKKSIIISCTISVLIHGLILLALQRPRVTSNLPANIRVTLNPRPPIKAEKQIERVQEPPIKQIPEQIVDIKNENKLAPQESSYKSEFDNRVEKQIVKRGEPVPANSTNKKLEHDAKKNKVDKEQPKSEKSQKLANSPNSNQPPILRLNEESMGKAFSFTKENKVDNNKQNEQQRNSKFRSAEPFTRQNSVNSFLGPVGSADYLPNVPDGDITLLNTKADHFAGFVRRVAQQVFGALRRESWQTLSRNEIGIINDFVTVEAVMSKSGKLLKTKITSSSGSKAFDNLLEKSAEIGTWDQNPPAEAAAESDNNIHFIFQSRTWSRIHPNGISEQRWLLLGTGLL